MVTHPKSLGLVALETAMAGSLVLSPTGCMSQDRLDTISHVTYGDSVDWTTVINQIDPHSNTSSARKNTWDALAPRVVSHLRNPNELK